MPAPQTGHVAVHEGSVAAAFRMLQVLVHKARHEAVVAPGGAAVGVIPAGEAADVAVEMGRDVVELVKDGDQLLPQRPVDETGEREINDIEHSHPVHEDVGHGIGDSLPPPPGAVGRVPAGEAQGVDLGVDAMGRRGSGGIEADQQPAGVDVGKLAMTRGYMPDEALEFRSDIESGHDTLLGERNSAAPLE